MMVPPQKWQEPLSQDLTETCHGMASAAVSPPTILSRDIQLGRDAVIHKRVFRTLLSLQFYWPHYRIQLGQLVVEVLEAQAMVVEVQVAQVLVVRVLAVQVLNHQDIHIPECILKEVTKIFC